MECLLSLQRYDECLAMINRELVTDESNPTLYVLRAQINILFGNVSPSSTLHLTSLPPLLLPTPVLPSPFPASSLLLYFAWFSSPLPTPFLPHPIHPQATLGYHDVCSALQIDPLHKDATEIKKKLQKDALACKNQVRMLMSHTLKPCYVHSLKPPPPPLHP